MREHAKLWEIDLPLLCENPNLVQNGAGFWRNRTAMPVQLHANLPQFGMLSDEAHWRAFDFGGHARFE